MHGGGANARLFFALSLAATTWLEAGCSARRSVDAVERDPVGMERSATAADTRRWFEKQKITATDSLGVFEFGAAIAASGDSVVVGAPSTEGADGDPAEGRAYAFERSADGWEQTQTFAPRNPVERTSFGIALAMSDDALFLASPGENSVYVYSRLGSDWVSQQVLDLPAPSALAVEGDIAVVGAKGENAAFVLQRVNGVWTKRATLTPSDVGLWDFGASVAISGTTVVVGAPHWGISGEDYRGAAYVFVPSGALDGDWNQTQLRAFDGAPNLLYGHAVGIQGTSLVIGSPVYGAWVKDSGIVYFYTMTSVTPWPVTRKSFDRDIDGFGSAIAFSGNSVVIGAPNAPIGSTFGQGAAYVFSRSATDWVLDQKLTLENGRGMEGFGSSLAFWNERVFSGAPWGPQGQTNHGAAYFDALLEVVGRPCGASSDCGLGNCVSDTCCSTACDGACEGCTTGECEPVRAGEEVEKCGLYLCDGVSGDCPSSCTVNTDCVETHYCKNGTCVEKLDLGERCSGPDECASKHCGAQNRCVGSLANGESCSDRFRCRSGYCEDGVCCNEACGGQCEACNEEASPGECSAVSGEPRGERSRCAGEGECGGECRTDNRNECHYPTSAKPCGATCVGETLTRRTCDGAGACVDGDSAACEGGYVCESDTSCRTICAADGDCAEGLVCGSDGSCGPSAFCEDDGLASVTTRDGVRHDCGRYRCGEDGSCKQSCIDADDCARPNVCFEHACGPMPADDAGCGCRTPSRAPSRRLPVAAVLVGLFLIRRGRRRGTFSPGRWKQ